MSVDELLEQVQARPPRERQKFVLAVLALEEGVPAQTPEITKCVKWPTVEARAKHIFGDRVLPKLVL
jgi:hypothetical protein